MKQWRPVCVLAIFLALLIIAGTPVRAQFRNPQLTWVGTALNADKTVDGYYQSLPADYSTSAARYPLLIYLHGDESVEGTHEDILKNSIPRLISEGAFPEAFTVNGKTHHFIVIAPHYTIKNLQTDALSEAIHNIIRKFRVNANRIYLTGMSRGGGYTWDYAGASMENATRLAAIVPIAGAQSPDPDHAAVIGDADLPVWATHNEDDYLVPSSNTTTYVDWINDRKPTPRSELTLFKSTEHEGWTRTYDPASKAFKGKNIYAWMLQYTRGEEVQQEVPLEVTISSFKLDQSASGDVTLTWAAAGAPGGSTFMIERSNTQDNFTKITSLPAASQQNTYTYIDKDPLPGDNFYRLTLRDANGNVLYEQVQKISLVTSNSDAITLYPNPVSSQATFSLTHSDSGSVHIAVFNSSGALVQQLNIEKQAPTFQQSLSFSQLPTGSYVLQVQSKTFKQSLSFVKR